MPIDRPEETDVLVEARKSAPDVPACRVPAETRDRATYAHELRAAVAADRWQSVVDKFTERWADHQARWPDKPADSRPDDATSELRKQVDAGAGKEVDRGWDHIRDNERRIITPAMRDIEAQDPSRELTGLDYRLKGPDRLKEKVARALKEQPDLTSDRALALIPDTIRFTFSYSDQHYVAGVRADIERLNERGFELVKPLKNSWDAQHYKGINSQWRHAETGQRFEVQFHTATSFEAKQLTHGIYERIRCPDTEDAQLDDLVAIQRDVCSKVPVPPGALEIREYPWKARDD